MFCKTLKSFDTVNMILSAKRKCFGVVDTMMLPELFERVVTSEHISKVYRPFPCFLSDDLHQLFFTDMLYHSRIYSSITLQQAKYNAFTLGATSTRFPLRLPPKYASSSSISPFSFFPSSSGT